VGTVPISVWEWGVWYSITKMLNPSLDQIDSNAESCGKNQYQWTFTGTVTVSDVWVADGFNLTPERLQRIIQDAFVSELGFADHGEVMTTSMVTGSPDPMTIRKEQGYVE
jgi:hypothetical protein